MLSQTYGMLTHGMLTQYVVIDIHMVCCHRAAQICMLYYTGQWETGHVHYITLPEQWRIQGGGGGGIQGGMYTIL